MKDRIKQLMESQHMTQQTFADFIGISTASLSSIFNGRTKPTLNTVEAIKGKFTTINLEWLMYGSGPMFKEQATAMDSGDNTKQSINEGAFEFGGDERYNAPLSSRLSESVSDYSVRKTSNNIGYADVKYIDKPQRSITEIRIFFDDQTWESFVPKK